MRTALDFPGEPAGQEVGYSSAIVGDVNGDGRNDLVVGGIMGDLPGVGTDAGLAWLYLGTATGFEAEPAMVFDDVLLDRTVARFGQGVVALGDFDGDGRDDFAVAARYENRPNNNRTNYAFGAECEVLASDGGNRGAVFVFLGKADGLPEPKPAFVAYGPHNSSEMWMVGGGGDVNGDGYDDLVMGGELWDGPAGREQRRLHAVRRASAYGSGPRGDRGHVQSAARDVRRGGQRPDGDVGRHRRRHQRGRGATSWAVGGRGAKTRS